ILYKSGLEKFIFLGSMNEYGDRIGPLYEEMKPMGWITNYAKGKIDVAKFGFEKAKEMDKKFIHIRLFYTYGAVYRKNTLIQDLYHGYKKNTKISLGHCEHYRDYVYVSDVVKGIRLLRNINESTTVNLGSGKAIKLKEFVNLFWKILGGKPEMLHFGDKPIKKEQPQPNCFANLDKLEALIKWKPSISLEEGIKLTIKELDNRYSNTIDVG
ncbi:MAG: NAD(P)-dependent oxidoreductase, partial [Patescibacteria group bacterium]|nr:NAD(P)-dependent oxidoreductase [Patescibacteria group bacterium]